jgi:propionyl-CoA synthetase
MEEIVASHAAVAECAVIGVADELKGQVPVGLVVLKADVSITHEALRQEIVDLVREQLGPVGSFKHVVVVRQLPKTRSGKILRRTIRSLVEGESFRMPSTIEEPAVLDELAVTLREQHIAGERRGS